MKKMLLCSLIVCLSACGINKAETKQVDTNVVDLSQRVKIPSFDLEFDWQNSLQEKYGSIAFKAFYLCGQKNSKMLNGIDTSSDYGSSVLNDYNNKVLECSINSLKDEEIVPINLRHKIPKVDAQDIHEQKVYEIKENLEPYEELPATDYNVNDPRYEKIKEQCEENNSYYKGTIDFDSNVEFCIRKGM